VTGREGFTVQTDRGELSAPLIVDALGWRRVLSNATAIQPPAAPLSRGLEVHPAGRSEEMQLWIDPAYVRAGYAWSFPARDEMRVGAGSFWPSMSRSPRSGWPATSACLPRAIRATGFPTGCARPLRMGCSSRATPPGTACR